MSERGEESAARPAGWLSGDRAAGAVVVLAAWSAVALLFALEIYVQRGFSRDPVPFDRAFQRAAAHAYVWAALTFAVLYVSRRFRIERPRVAAHLAVHLALSGLFCLAHAALVTLVIPLTAWIAPERGFDYARAFPSVLGSTLNMNVLTYWVLVGVFHALAYYRESRDREVRALQLEARLATAQLDVLRMQLHPHFLFNTLNTISGLIHDDPDAAERMVARLSDMLRFTLSHVGVQQIPLREEIELLQLYLEIERARFEDRLSVRIDVDPEAARGRVPTMLLQPIVENAIRHGIAPLARGGTVAVRAARDEGRLVLEVSDDGRGLPDGAPPREGIGLGNTRSRLRQIYGEEQGFELRGAPGAGTTARIVIPFSPG